jgi:hypothetical protein
VVQLANSPWAEHNAFDLDSRLLVALRPARDLLLFAKDLFVAAIGGGGHDEKEGAPAGGGLRHASRGR